MPTPFILFALFEAFILTAPTEQPTTTTPTKPDKQITKTVRSIVANLRYARRDPSVQLLDTTAIAQTIIGSPWDNLSVEQKNELASSFGVLIIHNFIKKTSQDFRALDAHVIENITLDNPNAAHCKSTMMIHRNMKKEQIPLEWQLHQQNQQWRITDISIHGESTIQHIKTDQIQRLLARGGIDMLLNILRKKVAALPKSSS
jgi:ABC-type transporter MlaC component